MKKVIKYIFILVLFPILFLSVNSFAKEDKIIRVGWFDSVFNRTDEDGRKTGYCYDYQQKLSIYTGWKYQYVSGSWPDLLQMLIDGKLDLLGDVSYTEARASKMKFSSLPMGSEDYFIYKSPQNKEITNSNFKTFNNKKVGINKESIMINQFSTWANNNGINAEIVELTSTTNEALELLNRGAIDMYISMDGALDNELAIPLCEIGSSNFYFAVRNDAEDILSELNFAMNKINNDDPFFNDILHAKYFKNSGENLYLNEEELNFINNHKKIKIGYQDNYLAFCAKDSSGNLTGALKDYLNMASTCFKNATVDFEPIAYPTATQALDGLKAGEVDCMFPANLSVYDGEINDLFMSNPLMKTEIAAVIKESDQKTFFKKDRVAVAVNSKNQNYEMFLKDNFPDWRIIYYDSTEAGLKGIADGQADCLLISNYRYNNISTLCDKYNLVTLSTGVEIDYCFAVNRTDSILYSILNKIISNVPESSVNTALSYYYTEDAKVTFGDFLSKNFGVIMLILAIIALVIMLLILRNVHIEKKSKSRQLLIKATEIDDKTSLYNKIYFIEYANRLYRDKPDIHMDMIAINVERFHFINSLNGRKFGDQVLIEISDEIKTFLKDKNGIAGHLEADRFAIYCNHLEDYNKLIDNLQGRIDMLSINANIRIKMGVMPYKEGIDPTHQLEQALAASNLALTEFKENLVVFDKKMSDRESLDQRLLNDLRSSVENKEFSVYYQPKYDITSDEPKLVGVEALVRWKHKDLGFIFPNEFIPLFEKNGQIGILDKYVRTESVKKIAEWKEKYGFILPISVNVSRIEVLDQTFVDQLEILLEEYNLPTSALNLEVTESAYIDDKDYFIEAINNLRNSGFKIEMDDFGTGYSSLNMLSLMPVDILKMDRGFIFDIETNEKNVHFVELILGIARNLKVPVIAEGVETKEQLNILKNLGCDIIQGYYFSKPLPETEFEETILDKLNK